MAILAERQLTLALSLDPRAQSYQKSPMDHGLTPNPAFPPHLGVPKMHLGTLGLRPIGELQAGHALGPPSAHWSLESTGVPGSALESLHCNGHSLSPARCQPGFAWQGAQGQGSSSTHKAPSREEIGQRHCHSARVSAELVIGMGPLGQSESTQA